MSCSLPILIWPNGVPHSSGKAGRRNATIYGNPVLHSLQACSAQPRPGDVYKPRGVSGPIHRPLGLIPQRRREGMWKELSLMLSSFSDSTEQSELSMSEGVEEERSEHHQLEEIPSKAGRECRGVVITKNLGKKEPWRKVKMSPGRHEPEGIEFRRKEVHDVDLDYLDICNCSLKNYPSLVNEPATVGVNPRTPVPSVVTGQQRHNMARCGNAHTKALRDKTKGYIFHTNYCFSSFFTFPFPFPRRLDSFEQTLSPISNSLNSHVLICVLSLPVKQYK